MINNSDSTLVVIPARGGSKRLPGKNVLPLDGKPLIAWTIETAIEACSEARIIITSDDDEVLSIGAEYRNMGIAIHRREPRLATDTATTADVLIDAVETERARGRNPEVVILLQPTSPLRTSVDIENAVELFHKSEERSTVVSVCEVDHPMAWTGRIMEGSRLAGLDLSSARSQDHGKEYRLNGAVYVASVSSLLTTGSFFTDTLLASVMPRERSIDIDNEMDFRMCECFIQYQKKTNSEINE